MFAQSIFFTLMLLIEGGVHVHPFSFQINKGQAPADVRYLFSAGGYQLDFKRGEIVLHLNATSLRIRFAGRLNKLAPEGHARLDGLIRYVDSNGPEDKNPLPTFGSVRYESLYTGIDLGFYGRRSRLETDFIVAPGADPQQIHVVVEGGDRVELDKEDLQIQIGSETIRFHQPNAFQIGGSGRQPVEVRYQLSESDEIRLVVGKYDQTLPLIIGL